MYRQSFQRNKPQTRQFRPRFAGASIHASRYVNRASEAIPVKEHSIVHMFTDFAMDSRLKENIAAHGFTSPTPIQDQVIPHILEGRDVVGIANTGTGKTAAFLLPLIDKAMRDPMQKILVIAPTRELALQIDDELRIFARGLRVQSALIIGGASMGNQMWKLKQRPNFLISTPGRLKDFVNRGIVRLAEYKTIVLDEVDRMVDIGFIRDIRFIISALPVERQSLFFSATVSPDIQDIIHTFLKNPVTVSVKVKETAQSIDQDVIHVRSREEKFQKLHSLLSQEEFSKVLIFGRTKWNVEKLTNALAEKGFSVGSIHGNKSQGQRMRVLDAFKQNYVKILVATDVAARGLDIEDVSHVINFDEPASYEDYVHRIGRTGRANKKGKALTFVG